MLLIHVITESQTFAVEFDLMDTFERKSSLQKKKRKKCAYAHELGWN